jgi:hypothetical protein
MGRNKEIATPVNRILITPFVSISHKYLRMVQFSLVLGQDVLPFLEQSNVKYSFPPAALIAQ